jgi:hypothetical protein
VLVQLNPLGNCCTDYVSDCFVGYRELWCKKDVNYVISGMCCKPCNTFIPSDPMCDGEPCTSDKEGFEGLSELGQRFKNRARQSVTPPTQDRVEPKAGAKVLC